MRHSTTLLTSVLVGILVIPSAGTVQSQQRGLTEEQYLERIDHAIELLRKAKEFNPSDRSTRYFISRAYLMKYDFLASKLEALSENDPKYEEKSRRYLEELERIKEEIETIYFRFEDGPDRLLPNHLVDPVPLPFDVAQKGLGRSGHRWWPRGTPPQTEAFARD